MALQQGAARSRVRIDGEQARPPPPDPRHTQTTHMVACKLLEEDQGSLEGLLGVAVRGLLEEVTANKHGYRGSNW